MKESDRIAAVVDGLNGLGGDLEAPPDGFVVRGTGGLRGGVIDAAGDHRTAMLGAIAGLASREGVRVVGMEAGGRVLPRLHGGSRAPAAMTTRIRLALLAAVLLRALRRLRRPARRLAGRRAVLDRAARELGRARLRGDQRAAGLHPRARAAARSRERAAVRHVARVRGHARLVGARGDDRVGDRSPDGRRSTGRTARSSSAAGCGPVVVQRLLPASRTHR